MKKFLSLVLALIMVMSLVTISAGADYADAADINYDEAVDVISALEVVGGSGGSFFPKSTLSRGAAAKIICNLTLGVDLANTLPADASTFSDVPAGSTFASYIAYCAEKGIVGGYPDGTFRPSNPVSGTAFLKMLLCALGYDAEAEGFAGGNTAVNVSLKAVERDLLKGLKGSFLGSKNLTREEAALFAFNTLKSQKVTYPNASNSKITIGDIVIENKGAPVYTTNAYFYETSFANLGLIDATDVDGGTAGVQVAANAKGMMNIVATGADDFNRTAYSWYVDKADVANGYSSVDDTLVGEYAVAPDYTYVVTGTKDDALSEICKALGVEDVVVGDPSFNVGEVVELYTNTDGKVNSTNVIVTKLAKVTKVVAANKDADYAYTVSLKVGTSAESYKDTELTGFDAATMVKDTYVLYTPSTATGSHSAILAKADVVSGKQTAYGTGYTKIAGTKLTFSNAYYAYDALDNVSEFDVYCDANGFAVGSVKVKAAEEAVKLFYVTGFNMVNPSDAFTAQKAQASVVYLDGSKAVLDIDVYTKSSTEYVKFAGSDVAFTTGCKTVSDAGWYSYAMNSDGVITNLTKVDTGTAVKNTKIAAGKVYFKEDDAKVSITGVDGKLYATKTTTVTTLKDGKATVVTGYANFTDTTYNTAASVVYTFDGDTLLNVYIYNENAMTAADETVYGWYVSTGDTYQDAKDNTVTDVVYNVKGVDTTYTVNSSTASAIAGGSYKALVSIVVTDGIAALESAGTANAKLAKVDAEYVLFNSGNNPQYLADTVKFYDVTDVAKNGVVELDELTKNSIVTYVMGGSPSKVTYVYVTYAAQDDGIVTANAAYVEKVLGFDSGTAADAVTNTDWVVFQYTRPADTTKNELIVKDSAGTVVYHEYNSYTTAGIKGFMIDVNGSNMGDTTVDTTNTGCVLALTAGATYTYYIECNDVVVLTGTFVVE